MWSSWGHELYPLMFHVFHHSDTLKCYFLKSFWPGLYQCAFSPLSFGLLFICTGPYPYLVFICILNFLFFIVFSLKTAWHEQETWIIFCLSLSCFSHRSIWHIWHWSVPPVAGTQSITVLSPSCCSTGKSQPACVGLIFIIYNQCPGFLEWSTRNTSV